MKAKKRLMYFIYFLPIIISVIRIILTFVYLIKNPLELGLRFIQIVPVIALIASGFSYLKLYSDSVPVITLFAPSMLHAVLIFAFTKKVVWIPFVPLVSLDICYVILKSVKSNLFPFYIEGEDDDETQAINDLFAEAE